MWNLDFGSALTRVLSNTLRNPGPLGMMMLGNDVASEVKNLWT